MSGRTGAGRAIAIETVSTSVAGVKTDGASAAFGWQMSGGTTAILSRMAAE